MKLDTLVWVKISPQTLQRRHSMVKGPLDMLNRNRFQIGSPGLCRQDIEGITVIQNHLDSISTTFLFVNIQIAQIPIRVSIIALRPCQLPFSI